LQLALPLQQLHDNVEAWVIAKIGASEHVEWRRGGHQEFAQHHVALIGWDRWKRALVWRREQKGRRARELTRWSTAPPEETRIFDISMTGALNILTEPDCRKGSAIEGGGTG
jgi:hypothetical protein